MTAAPSNIPSRWSPERLTVPLLVIAAGQLVGVVAGILLVIGLRNQPSTIVAAYVVGAFANAVIGFGIVAIALGLRAAR
jgi:hypothetical protein